MPHLAQAEASRHKCLIYDGHPAEQLPVVVPLLTDGLRDNWKCLFLGSPEMVQQVDRALAQAGIDTAREKGRGALSFSSDRGHLDGAGFDPKRMIDGLCEAVDGAVAAGFHGLCATGDMSWELGSPDNFERLLEYEALLEQAIRDHPLKGICQYRRETVPPSALQHALMAHSAVYVGNVLCGENVFYLPPELILEGSVAGRSEWMCRQLVRLVQAEQAREEAHRALRGSEEALRRLAAQLVESNRGLQDDVRDRTEELDVRVRAQVERESHDDFVRRTNAFVAMLSHELRKEPVDLADVVRRSLDTARPLLDERRHEVLASLPDTPLNVVGDAVRLEQAVVNLVVNAAKYTEPGGRIRVELTRDPERALLRIRDNGIGIDARMLPRVFDLFAQADRALDRAQGGLGVGLTLVKHLVERHGGAVGAASEGLGCGSEFTVCLPLAPESRLRPKAPAPAPQTPLRVLVVDDHADSADMLGQLLRGWGHQVGIARDGHEALAVYAAAQPDVAFIDIGLPGIDGYELAHRIRAVGRPVTLAALTGYGQDSDRDHAVGAGFDEHFAKPADPVGIARYLAAVRPAMASPK